MTVSVTAEEWVVRSFGYLFRFMCLHSTIGWCHGHSYVIIDVPRIGRYIVTCYTLNSIHNSCFVTIYVTLDNTFWIAKYISVWTHGVTQDRHPSILHDQEFVIHCPRLVNCTVKALLQYTSRSYEAFKRGVRIFSDLRFILYTLLYLRDVLQFGR